MTNRFLRWPMLALLAATGLDAGAACLTTSISPTALPAATVGAGYDQTLTASGVGALPYDFAVTSGSSAGLDLGVVDATNARLNGTPAQAGRYLFTVTATDASGCSGGRTYQLDVGAGTQTISFTSSAPSDARFGGAPYTVSATATSGLAVSLAIDASAASVCSLSGSTVSFDGVGTCVIDADQAGDADWNAAPRVQQSFAVGKATQSITFTSSAPPAAVVGGAAYDVAATASSGLAVTFSIDASAAAVCSIAGSSVSFHGAGTCVIDANQAGDASYEAAPQMQQSFAVGRSQQTISFTTTPPAAVVGGAPYAVAATASSGLPVTFSIDPAAAAVCSISGATVSFHGAGTCVIDANQPGDASYDPAPQIQQSFAVDRGQQTISFTTTPPAAVVGGAPYAVAATASSGLPVTFSIDPVATAVCSISGSTVSFHGAGTCVIDANQPGDANYDPAPQMQQSFAVGIGSQTLTFTSTPPAAAAVAGATYTPTATSSAGLPVTLTIDASAASVCSIAGGVVSFQHAGTCVIDANQPGDANYAPAPQVQQSFAVAPGVQTLSFTSAAPTGAVVAGATYTPTATSSAGLPVTLTIDASAASVCSIAGGVVSFQGAGTCVIDANQPGDADWSAAPQLQQSFAVGKGSQTISFTSTAPTDARIGGTPYSVAATATSGLPVALSIDASASGVCSISGNTVSFLGAGTCVIDADQAGDANWTAAPRVQQSFAVSACLTLAVGQVVLDGMPGGANVCVQNADGANAEFTYLPINIAASGDVSLSVTGNNIVAVSGPPAPIAPTGSSPLAPLHDPLDEELEVDYHAAETSTLLPDPVADPRSLVPPFGLTAGPLTVGQLIDLNASVGGCSVAPDIRKGRVEAITTPQAPGQQVLYAVQEVVETSPGSGDWHAPVPGGYTTALFQAIIDAFVQAPPGSVGPAGTPGPLLKNGMMDTFTGTFGDLTDVDGNGGVIVFFTPKMNELSPPASSTVQIGLFQPRDLFSAATCAGSNEAEILYLLVPDPTGVVNSNVRTLSFAYGNAGPTLVHHFEHLFNAVRRLYFNSAPALEEPWLDEALAWSAQELAFFNASVGLTPRSNIVVTNLTTGPNAAVRVNDFNMYENPMYGAMRTYFLQLSSGANGNKRLGPLRRSAYTSGLHDATAPNFVHTYMFLRYAIDRKNTGDAALFSALVNTTQIGVANLQTVFGADPNDWMRDFLVAIYADDAVAGLDARYTLPSWNIRSLYTALNGSYQLVVDPLANAVPLSFALSPGGGTRYLRFGVTPGQAANLTLTEGGVAPTSPVTMALVRTK
ncbi:Ig domain-containing protein [Dokdonella sp.]|uniref:Ig domain-containing protein n=1 Tax=Dokdonella sp. TaxID=2291710 RepID=UPI001B200DD9|nr:Ig domain-containing protein [Dokdonella sp.]MBO9662745.1 putative Ig domain-containing protein [Dokdonella sp.]